MTTVHNVSIRVSESLQMQVAADASSFGLSLRTYACVLMREYLEGKRTQISVSRLRELREDKPERKIIVGMYDSCVESLSDYCTNADLRIIDVWRHVLTQKRSSAVIKALKAEAKREADSREVRVMRSYKIPVAIAKALDAHAEKHSISRTDVLVEALGEYLK